MKNQDSTTKDFRRKKITLLIARIFVIAVALFFSLAIVPKLMGQYFDALQGEGLRNGGWEGWVMEITYYVFIIGFVFSWWKKCIAAILLLLASVIQMGPFLIIDGNLGSLIFGIPILISGVLFLIVCKS